MRLLEHRFEPYPDAAIWNAWRIYVVPPYRGTCACMDYMDLSKKDKFKGRCIITGLYIIAAIFLSGCATPKNIFVKNVILKDDKPSLAEDIIIDKAETPFRIGEELNYEVRWLGVRVGTVVAKVKGIEVIDGNEAYVVELKAKTNDFLSKIYPINDTFTSYIDKKKFVSLKHVV